MYLIYLSSYFWLLWGSFIFYSAFSVVFSYMMVYRTSLFLSSPMKSAQKHLSGDSKLSFWDGALGCGKAHIVSKDVGPQHLGQEVATDALAAWLEEAGRLGMSKPNFLKLLKVFLVGENSPACLRFGLF